MLPPFLPYPSVRSLATHVDQLAPSSSLALESPQIRLRLASTAPDSCATTRRCLDLGSVVTSHVGVLRLRPWNVYSIKCNCCYIYERYMRDPLIVPGFRLGYSCDDTVTRNRYDSSGLLFSRNFRHYNVCLSCTQRCNKLPSISYWVMGESISGVENYCDV